MPHRPPESGGAFTFENGLFDALLGGPGRAGTSWCWSAPRRRWPAFRRGGNGKTVPIRFPRLRRVWGAVSAGVNGLFNSGLHLPHPLRNEAWIDPLLARHGVGFFLNLTPESPTRETPYLLPVWDLQHRLQPFFPEVDAQGRWGRSEARFATLLRRATYVSSGPRAGKDEVRQFYGVSAGASGFPPPDPEFALRAAKQERGERPDVLPAEGDYMVYPGSSGRTRTTSRCCTPCASWRTSSPTAAPRPGRVGPGEPRLREAAGGGAGRGGAGTPSGVRPEETLVGLYRHALAYGLPSLFGPENALPWRHSPSAAP